MRSSSRSTYISDDFRQSTNTIIRRSIHMPTIANTLTVDLEAQEITNGVQIETIWMNRIVKKKGFRDVFYNKSVYP